MSTTFGVKVPSFSDSEFEDEEDGIVAIAFRSNDGSMYWKIQIAQLLPDDLEVIPLDNTAQGIFTIGDIKREISES